MSNRAYIKPVKYGFEFDNGNNCYSTGNPDDIGAYLEPMLWPLIEPALKAKKPITITIQYGTD